MAKAKYYRGNKALWVKWYTINKKYFDGNLQFPMELKFKKMSRNEGHTQFFTSGAVRVFVNEDFRGHLDVAEVQLLHEMIHVYLGPEYKGDHGMRFEAEKVRLFMAGAYDKIL